MIPTAGRWCVFPSGPRRLALTAGTLVVLGVLITGPTAAAEEAQEPEESALEGTEPAEQSEGAEELPSGGEAAPEAPAAGAPTGEEAEAPAAGAPTGEEAEAPAASEAPSADPPAPSAAPAPAAPPAPPASPAPEAQPEPRSFTPPQRANAPAESDLNPYFALGLGGSTTSGVGFLVRGHASGRLALQLAGGGFTTRSDDRRRAAYAVGGEVQATLRRGVRHRLFLMTGVGVYGDRDESTDPEYGWVDETVFLAFGAGIGGEIGLGSRQIREGFSFGGAFLPVQVRMFLEDTRGNRSAVGPGVGVWGTYNF